MGRKAGSREPGSRGHPEGSRKPKKPVFILGGDWWEEMLEAHADIAIGAHAKVVVDEILDTRGR